MLVILGGLPATGKTTIAQALAREIGAVHLRVDTIEQAIGGHPVGVVGYAVAYALAGDLLRQGFTVIAESVNPLHVTRQAWRDVSVDHLEVEVVCSDPALHKHRATTRTTDVPNLRKPTWSEITDREYEPWDRERLVLDTATRTVDDCVADVRAQLGGR